jgi:hypothetical protein
MSSMHTEKKYARINVLINRLDAGEDVSRSSLARVLTPEQMVGLDESWKTERASRKEPKPSEIRHYESLLGQGVMLYGRYEAKHQTLPAHESTRLISLAERELEKALEFAVELVQINSSFRMWFDRDPKDADCGAPASMPRVVTSKSHDNQSACKRVPFANSKRDLKLAALYDALEKLQPTGVDVFAESKSVLRDSRPWREKPDLSGWKF